MKNTLVSLLLILPLVRVFIDYRKGRIKSLTMISYQLALLCTIVLLNKPWIISATSRALGFALPSNFVLLTLILIGLITNYYIQLKVRMIEKRITKLARDIALGENHT